MAETVRPSLDGGTSYDCVAPFYDLLGTLYSCGAIARSKKEHLRWLKSRKSVLYAGAGTAEECLEAAALGTRVTVCDKSRKMLAAARQRFEAAGFSASYREGDALTLSGSFDVVVAPYFLNVFAPDHVGHALASLAAQVKPGGRLIVVDFRGPAGGTTFRLFQRLYYLLPQLLFLLLTRNPWHELYDYSKLARSVAPDLVVSERASTRVFGFPLLETICFERKARSPHKEPA